MFFELGKLGSASSLAPPWSPTAVRWLDADSFFVLRTVHEGESSRWCVGARVPVEKLYPHEKTFNRSVREKARVMRKVRMNPWPVFAAVDAHWENWTHWLESCVKGATPLVDSNYITLWNLSDASLLHNAGQFGLNFKHAIILDGHHSFEAQKTHLNRDRVLGWFLPFDHPELRVRAIHRGGWFKAAIEKALANGELEAATDAEFLDSKNNLHVFEVIQLQKKAYFKLKNKKQMAVDWIGALESPRSNLHVSSNMDELVANLLQNEFDTVVRLPDPLKPEVERRAVAKKLFPQKATYFYPKIPFGLMAENLNVS